MKNVLVQYLWIFSITTWFTFLVALLLLPEKKNRLEFLQNEIEKVQEQQKIYRKRKRIKRIIYTKRVGRSR